jgi:hypothetical protein
MEFGHRPLIRIRTNRHDAAPRANINACRFQQHCRAGVGTCALGIADANDPLYVF